MKDIQGHNRVNDILLAPLERPALRWLAAHMPDWAKPDHMTAVGVLGAVMILVSYSLTHRSPGYLWLVNLGFVINWFGDSLDGTLARHRNIQRPIYGFFLDHTIDAMNEVIIFLGLGLSPYMQFEISALALIGYLLMSVLVYVNTCVSGVFKISYGKLGPTEMRLIAVLANTAIFFFGNPTLRLRFGTFSGLDVIGILVAGMLGGIFLITTVKEARRLALLDP